LRPIAKVQSPVRCQRRQLWRSFCDRRIFFGAAGRQGLVRSTLGDGGKKNEALAEAGGLLDDAEPSWILLYCERRGVESEKLMNHLRLVNKTIAAIAGYALKPSIINDTSAGNVFVTSAVSTGPRRSTVRRHVELEPSLCGVVHGAR
jgi:hypothetical protein